MADSGRSSSSVMLGNADLHRELHLVGPRGKSIVEAVTLDYDLPLGLIAPCRPDHSLLGGLDADTLERSTKGNTLLMLLNAGPFHREITRPSLERQTLLF